MTVATIADAVIGPIPGMVGGEPATGIIVLVPGQDGDLDLLHPFAQSFQLRGEAAECLPCQHRHLALILADERRDQIADATDPLGRDDAQFRHVAAQRVH